MTDLVTFQCVKVGSKLRIRIISPGYNKEANCQFPRNIRVENATYTAPLTDISFSENAQRKFFYRVNKSNIKQNNIQIQVIYEEDDVTCVICFENEKSVVFATCGHYCCCEICSLQLKNKCPICRANIVQIVKRDQLAL